MKTKFIEGTNKQYSIREDGIVISHKSNKILKVNKKGHITLSLGARKKAKVITPSKLLKDYFQGVKCKQCNNNVFKPYFKLCNDCIKNNKLNSKIKFNLLNPNKTKEYVKTKVINLPKYYIAHNLNLKTKELPNNLYQLAKINLILKRKLKTL